MTNSIAKRALTVAVAAATILWSVGFAALSPQTASAASYGDLIKGTTLSTVYYYGSDGQRYSFPNEKTFFSWYNDFSGVVTMSDAELANITLAGNIVYRPGSRWVKITSDEKTYAVARDGKIHWIESEEVAKGLAGDNWNQFIDDVPDVFFVDYSVGDSLTSASSAYEGALVKSGSDTYLVWDGKKSKVSAAGMTANMFKSGFVLDGSGVNLSGMTAGSEITSKLAYLTDAAQKVETADYVTAKDVSVSFAGSPASSTLIAGQGAGDLAHITLTNNSGSEVKLTKAVLTRTGVSADATLSNLYLFDGYVRLTDAATISSGKATFNDPSGIWTLAAGASKTLVVRGEIAASTNGQTVGVKLAAASDLGFSSGGTASGSFPLEGATHTIAAAPSTFAAIATGAWTANPATNTSLDPAEDVRLWEDTISINNNEVMLKMARFRNIGSIDADDVTGWELFIGGVKRGSTVAMEDEDGYVTFDLSASPVELKTGSHVVKVQADVIGGSTRTIQVGLRNTADFIATDADYGQPVLIAVSSSTAFSTEDAGVQTVSTGSLTFTKKSDSPSGDVVEGASGVTLGKWEVKAFGENMKVEKLRFAADIEDDSNTNVAAVLRNGAVYLNGTQVGSTTALSDNSAGAAPDYTEYTFGSSFIVEPGKPATLEIRSDIYDDDGTDSLVNGSDIVAEISDNSSTSNVLRMTSGGYGSYPTAAVTANELNVTDGSSTLTVATSGTYGAQTTVTPKTNYKLGVFTVTAGTSEDVNLTDFEVQVDLTDTDSSSNTVATSLTNLYVKYGPQSNMTSTSTKGTVAATGNTWSTNYPLKKGEIIYFEVYADLLSPLNATDVIDVNLDVNGINAVSSVQPSTSAADGPNITIGSGTFTEFNDDHPVAAINYGNQEITVAKYRFSSSNETFTIKEMTTSIGASGATAVTEVRLYDGSTQVAATVYDENSGTRGTWTGLSIPVNANTSKVLTVKYLLNQIGSGFGTSQANAANTLYSVKFTDSNGVETTETSGAEFSSVNGNAQYVFRAIPTVTHTDLTNSTLVNGQEIDMYKFSVTASGGSIALKQLKFPITFTDADADTLEVHSWKLYKNGSDVSTSNSAIEILKQDGTSIESTDGAGDDTFTGGAADSTIIVVWDTNEETIGMGETVTYVLRATPTGFDSDGDTGEEDYFTIYLAGDSATNGDAKCLNDNEAGESWGLDELTSGSCSATDTNELGDTLENFIWSDVSGTAHAGASETGSNDWSNGYLVKNLNLSGETWSK